jgi:hypothetical protein
MVVVAWQSPVTRKKDTKKMSKQDTFFTIFSFGNENRAITSLLVILITQPAYQKGD